MSFTDFVVEITPIAGQITKVKKFLLGGNAVMMLNEIGDNRFETAKETLDRAKSVKPSGLETEIRIARNEFLGAYKAYHKQVAGFRGLMRRAGSAAFPNLPMHGIYEKIGEAALFMALCDKVLGETTLLIQDVQKAREAFEKYVDRIEAEEFIYLVRDDPETAQKGADLARKREKREKAAFEMLCQSLLN